MGKNKTIQRLTAMMLSVIMVVGMAPVSVAAETGEAPIGVGGDIAAFDALGADIAEQCVPVDTPQTDLKLPDTLRATVRLAASEEETALNSGETDSEVDSTNPLEISVPLPITWSSSPAYDGDTRGEYSFTPELPEGFALAAGVELPKITVTVTSNASTAPAARGRSTLFSTGSGETAEWELEGAGVEGDPLRIETAEQLAVFAWCLNNGALPDTLPDQPYLRLMNDIDLSEEYGDGWTPIGGYYNDKKEVYAFNGTFDGNGKTIRGLYIYRGEHRFVGLFGYIKEGTVKNLTVEGGNVTGYASTGGIVGDLYGGRVENCAFSGSITGENGTGGIVGDLSVSQVVDCVNTGSVSGILGTGGIIGAAGSDDEDDHIQNCVNTGAVTGDKGYTGGIVGLLVGMLVDRCVNEGTVRGGTEVDTGGVAGAVSDGTIQNCVNSGDISSNANNVGGVAGLVSASTIQNCVNYAEISNDANSVGGVAGFVEGGSVVTNCLTTGNISGEVTVIEPGGISGVAGRLHSEKGYGNNLLSDCVALGQSVINDGEMGNVMRIASTQPGNSVFNNFAWKDMQLWWDGELIPEEDYITGDDGTDADATTLQTLWTTGALTESWSDAGVWTLVEGKLPVLTGLPHQSDKFPSYIHSITGVTVFPDSISMQKGTMKSFTATVTGIGAFNDTVTWSVSGGTAGTIISHSGVLTVDADETADTLTVTATSNGDSSKKDTASVTVTDTPIIKYALTVNSGSGTGEYAEGANVTLTADAPAKGKLFEKWVVTSGTLDLGDAAANPITITMPAEAIIIGATYKDKPADPDPAYIATLSGGGAGAKGAGNYSQGTTVNIYAGNRSGYTFTGWASSDVAITNAGSKNASFTMPGKAVTVTANWSYNGGGGSGSDPGTGGGSNVIVTPPASDRPNTPTQGEIQVGGKVDSKGNLAVNITENDVNDALDKALAYARKNGNESNGITLVLKVNIGNKTVNSVTFNLPKAVQEFIISKKIVNIVIVADNPGITISIDLTALKEINKRVGTDVNITATRMDNSKLTGSAKTAIGSRPVFDFKVSYGNGKQIQSFGAGSVSVSIPYNLGATEKAGNVQAVYVDESGKVQWLINSVYDSVNRVLRFSTNHFSTYGVEYKQDAPTFTDIGSHWAKDDIAFVVNRGLFSGTSKTTFSANIAMTRGMFVTALGRLANADVSSYKHSNFTDVKDDAYYMGYIEWASKNSIVSGIGDRKFAPDQSITREQMAVIMSNYAKTIGFTLPKVHVENIFAGNSKISAYAKDAVKQMQMAGVISGKSGNIIDPQGTATRAEVTAVLRRFVELEISSDTAQGWTMNDSGKWMYYENGKPVTGKKNIDESTYTFDQYGVTADVPKNLRYTTYTIQKGDSFWPIAHKLGCTMSELERLNNKSRFSLIQLGDVLRVPEK